MLRSITAYDFNLAANFEPVYGIIAAALIFGENGNLKPAFYLGALVIVLANFIHPLLQKRFSPDALIALSPLHLSGRFTSRVLRILSGGFILRLVRPRHGSND